MSIGIDESMAERILIKGSGLWDGTADGVMADGAVVVGGGRIEAVAPSTAIAPSSWDRVIDFTGCTLLPGLIDSHTHHSMDASLDGFLERMSDPIPVLTLRAAAMMRIDLRSGVTTCRTLGDREYLDVACKRAVAGGLLEGPRAIVAGKGIRAADGYGYVGYPFSGPDAIRRAIADNIAAGADFTKIYITGTLRKDGAIPAYLTRDEIEAAIETSHAAGLPVASHCVGGPGLDWALELGLDTLEHAYHISDTQVEALARSNTRLILTPGPILNDAIVNRYPPQLVEPHLRERDEMARSMAATIEAGIPFAIGTDGMHGGIARDAEYLVGLGASNLAVLRGLTTHGAAVCGMADQIGTLQPGRCADLIAVEGNPLDDIGSLQRVHAVVKDGRVYTTSRQVTV